jgi:hypothetical protein
VASAFSSAAVSCFSCVAFSFDLTEGDDVGVVAEVVAAGDCAAAEPEENTAAPIAPPAVIEAAIAATKSALRITLLVSRECR